MYKYEYVKNNNTILLESNEELTPELVEGYVNLLKNEHAGEIIEEIKLRFDGDNVAAVTTVAPQKFDKIRRITGYLVGTVDRFNDGKRAEEHDRVKHGLEA